MYCNLHTQVRMCSGKVSALYAYNSCILLQSGNSRKIDLYRENKLQALTKMTVYFEHNAVLAFTRNMFLDKLFFLSPFFIASKHEIYKK